MPQLSEARLRAYYRSYNQKWFGGLLPADVEIVWVQEPNDTEHLGWARREGNRAKIYLSPAFHVSRRFVLMSLLHEQGHVEVWPYLGHGERFQLVMQRLAAAGAMKNLW